MSGEIATVWQSLGTGQRGFGWTLRYTGTPTGEFKVWGANLSDQSDAIELPNALLDSGAPTDPNGSGAGNAQVIVCGNAWFEYVGLSYVSSAGTGTLTVDRSEKANL